MVFLILVSGPYVFGVGLTTYLCSKEIYVMEHEYYTGLSLLIMGVYAVKKFGPSIGKSLDKEIDVRVEWNLTHWTANICTNQLNFNSITFSVF